MSPEQERVLYEVLGHTTETKTLVRSYGVQLAEHEAVDDKAHERIGKVEKTLTKLLAAYGAAIVIIPAVLYLLGR